MALIWRSPLTTNGNDIIGGVTSVNNGGVTFSPTDGARLNGINQWLSFYKLLDVKVPFSFSIWLKFDNTEKSTIPFGAGDASTDHAIYVAYTNQGEYNFIFGAVGGTGVTGSAPKAFNSINYPPTSHVLCVMTWDGVSHGTLYRGSNMICNGYGSPAPASLPLDGNWSIGRLGLTGAMGLFKGCALDARIYNNELTQSDVLALYNAGPNNIPPVVLYKQRLQVIGFF